MKDAREFLSAAAIKAMEGEVRVHTLNPNAVRISKSLGDAVGLTQLGVHMVTIMPDHESAEYHRHLYEEEFAYVLSGNGLAVIDDKSFEITTGVFLGFPRRGVAHSISNNGSASHWFSWLLGSGWNMMFASTQGRERGCI